MGAKKAQYESRAPLPGPSFIHVDDFDSPKSLAIYLDYLDTNRTAYLEYFAWKRRMYAEFSRVPANYLTYSKANYFLKPTFVSPMCELCLFLHNETYMREAKAGVRLSQSYNFIDDCYTKVELEGNPKLTFDNLKNRCFFNTTDNDWSL